MKIKTPAAITALISAALILSACGNSGSSGTETSAATTTTTAAATTTAAPDNGGAEIATDDDETPDGGEEFSRVQFETDNALRPLIEAMVSEGEWPFMAEVTDKDMIKDFYCVDLDALAPEAYVFTQCMMSANMTELHIIKSSDVNAAKAALEARQEKAKSSDAFYPEDVEKAEASIVGTEGDYAYFIMALDAQAAETRLVNAIKAQ